MASNKPVPLPTITLSDIERFKSKVNTSPGQGPNGDCHAFMGARTPRGYGVFVFCVAGKAVTVRANRVAYKIHTGKDPFPDFVLHTCDFAACCRGEHLYRGSNLQNMQDASRRGRMPTGDKNGSRLHPEKIVRGSKHHNAKGTEETAAEIRRLYAEGHLSSYALAKRLGINASTVQRIIRGVGWEHADGPRTTGDLTPAGERHYAAVLTASKVREMRTLKKTGISYQKIADQYGVSLYTAYAAITGKTWKDVE